MANREISVNLFNGVPTQGMATPMSSLHVALPCSGLTFRRMFLPKVSKAERHQMIAEELSYSLPFPLTEAYFGSVEVGEEAWVTVASDAVVAPVKDLYPKAQLDVEPLCYLRAAKAARILDALVVDFGASKTVFCGIENGQVGTVRVLLRGGTALTEELAKEAGVSFDEAELLKQSEGTEHPVVRRFFQELLEGALMPSPLPYRRVLVCGGGSSTNGLLRLLTKLWKDVDVEPFPLPGLLSASEHVVAYGAALAGRPKATRIQMEHSFRQISVGNGGPLAILPLVLTVLLMTLMTIGLEVRVALAEKKATELRTTLVQALDPLFPEVAKLQESEIVKNLKARLAQQRASSRNSPARVMDTLGLSSNAVTEKKDARVFSVIFEDNIIKLEGRASTLEHSEQIRTALEKIVQGAEKSGKTRPGPDNTFVFQLEGQLPDL